MKLDMPDTQVLKAVHPKAPDIFFATDDLYTLSSMMASGSDLSAPPDIRLFKSVPSMLAARTGFEYIDNVLKSDHGSYQIEAKIDGERIQLHTNRQKFSYYSRYIGYRTLV